jgi:type II secretory pathway component PulL
MSYRQRNLDFDFRVRDFQSLDELKAELVELGGLQVTVTTANAEAGRVRGQLRIQRVGS